MIIFERIIIIMKGKWLAFDNNKLLLYENDIPS